MSSLGHAKEAYSLEEEVVVLTEGRKHILESCHDLRYGKKI